MRGDLEQINLTDIFQTLGMSQMEGILKLDSPVEQREVYFHNGTVRCHAPLRWEARRIGQRLIRAGIIGQDQLRVALLSQKSSGRPIGEELIAQGFLQQEQLDQVMTFQAVEDLYSIFTWTNGEFEFYRGAPSSERQATFARQQPHDINAVLLEVARRSDEWEMILGAVHSIDEVPVRLDDHALDDVEGEQRLVMEGIDGKRSIRQIADTVLVGVFECAKLVKDLLDEERVALAPAERMLEIAEEHTQAGDVKQAVLVVHTLYARGTSNDVPTLTRMANIVQRCGEPRRASILLLSAAQQQHDLEPALELAREARRLDGRSVQVLDYLRRCLLEDREAREKDPDVQEVTSELVDALVEDSRVPEALELMAQLEAVDPDNPTYLGRKARLLHRLGRSEEAIAVLMALAETFKTQKRWDRLAATYEQILKIDYRRKDIAKALKLLHATRQMQRGKLIALAGIVVGVCLLCVIVFSSLLAEDPSALLAQAVADRLQAGDCAGAMGLVEEAVATQGPSPLHDQLRARIQKALLEREAADVRRREEQLQQRFTTAAADLKAGRVREAMQVWREFLSGRQAQTEAGQRARAAVQELAERMEMLARYLPHQLPPPPDPLQTDARRAELMAKLTADFEEADALQAQSLLAMRDDPLLTETWSGEQRQRLLGAATTVAAAHDQAKARRTEYAAYENKLEASKRLAPLFVAAKEYEARHQFREALEAYRQLAAEHPGEGDLKAHFQSQVERYATILRFLRIIEKATQENDFETARNQLRMLRRTYQGVPWDSLTQLPMQVDSDPPGADVLVDGKVVGKTPMHVPFTVANRTRLRVQREGYFPEERVLTGDEFGRTISLLIKAPLWSWSAAGPITTQAVADDGGRVFVADRAGQVAGLDLASGQTVWSHTTNDVSGLLPRPVVQGKRLIVASLDGVLRCYDTATGERLWQRDGIPCEAGPALCGDTLVAATVDARLVGVDPASGEVRWTSRLPGPVRRNVLAAGGSAVVATTAGAVLRFHAASGREAWGTQVGAGAATAPLLVGDALFVATEDGVVAALAFEDGKGRWRRTGQGDPLLRPAAAAGLLVLAVQHRLQTYRLADGTSAGTTTFEAERVFCADLIAVGDRVFASTREGLILVLEAPSMQVRYRMRADRPATAPALVTPTGAVVVGFEDRTLHCYGQLP